MSKSGVDPVDFKFVNLSLILSYINVRISLMIKIIPNKTRI